MHKPIDLNVRLTELVLDADQLLSDPGPDNRGLSLAAHPKLVRKSLMNAPLRMIVVVLVVGLLPLGVFVLRFAWSPSHLLEEIRHVEDLQRLKQATYRRMEARQQAVQEYIARRCTLAETMRRFQELDHEWPDYVTPNQEWWPSDEERHYQVLLAYAEGILQGQPEELAATLRRLEADRQQLQASQERQRLEEVSGR